MNIRAIFCLIFSDAELNQPATYQVVW